MQRAESDRKTEAETGKKQPKSKEGQQLPEAGRDKEQVLP